MPATNTQSKHHPWRQNCLLVGCLTSQLQASVSQGRICLDNFTCCHTEIEVADPTFYLDNFTCCHTEIEVADPTFYLTQSQYTDTGLTSPSTDPRMPGAWQGSHWSSHWYDSTSKKSRRKRDSNPGSSALEADAFPLGQWGGVEDRICIFFRVGSKTVTYSKSHRKWWTPQF